MSVYHYGEGATIRQAASFRNFYDSVVIGCVRLPHVPAKPRSSSSSSLPRGVYRILLASSHNSLLERRNCHLDGISVELMETVSEERERVPFALSK